MDKKIIIEIDMKQVAFLGAALDLYVKSNGMSVIGPVYEIQQQIKKQLPAKDPKEKK